MANENDLSGSVGLDTTNFKNGVAQLTQSIKNIETSFRAGAVAMGDWSSTSDGLKSRISSLSEKMDVQKQKLATYAEEFKRLQSAKGDNSKGLERLSSSMTSTERAIAATQRDIDRYTAALKNAESSESSGSSMLSRLSASFSKLSDQSSKSTSSIKDHFSSLKSTIAGAVAGIGISLGVSGLAHSIYGVAESASDLVEAQNVVENTFKSSYKTVEAWSAAMAQSAGISETSATQYVGAMGAMLKSNGLSEQAAGSMSEKLVQLTGDMSSFYNVSTSEMWEKIRAGISGETQPLKQLGINMDVANLSAYAMSQGIKTSYDKMTQAQQATLRYNYLLSVTSDAQGDFARTSSNSMANQARIFSMNIESMKETVGAAFLPMINSMFNAVNPFLQSLMPRLQSGAQQLSSNISNGVKAIQDVMSAFRESWTNGFTQMQTPAETFAARAADALHKISDTAGSVLPLLKSHMDLVKGAIVTIVATMAVWKTATLASSAVEAAQTVILAQKAIAAGSAAAAQKVLTAATQAGTSAQVASNASMIASMAPIVGIIAAIAVLSIGVYELVTHWKQVTQVATDFGQSVQTVMAELKSKVSEAIATAETAFTNLRMGALTSVQNGFKSFQSAIEKAKTAIIVTASVLGTIFGPALIKSGVEAAAAGGKILATYIARIAQTGTAAIINGAKVTVSFVASVAKSGAEAVIAAPKIIGSFVASMAAAGASAVANGAKVVASFVASMAQAAAQAVQTAAAVTGSLITSIVAYAAQGWAAVASIVAQSAAWIAQKAVMLASTVATNAMSAAQWALNAAMSANPIGILIVAIAGLIAALVALYNRNVQFRDLVNNMSGSIREGWMSVIGSIESAWNGLNPAQWGRDLVDGIANGIRSAADHVRTAAGNVAQDIRSFLHFSKPDTGPLADFDTYMPDMMTTLANGITGNVGKLRSAAAQAAGVLASGLQVAAVAPASSNSYSNSVTNNNSRPQFYLTINANGMNSSNQQDAEKAAAMWGNVMVRQAQRKGLVMPI